jgi:hypothetical protein
VIVFYTTTADVALPEVLHLVPALFLAPVVSKPLHDDPLRTPTLVYVTDRRQASRSHPLPLRAEDVDQAGDPIERK